MKYSVSFTTKELEAIEMVGDIISSLCTEYQCESSALLNELENFAFNYRISDKTCEFSEILTDNSLSGNDVYFMVEVENSANEEK